MTIRIGVWHRIERHVQLWFLQSEDLATPAKTAVQAAEHARRHPHAGRYIFQIEHTLQAVFHDLGNDHVEPGHRLERLGGRYVVRMLKILGRQVWKGPQLALSRFTHAVVSLAWSLAVRQRCTTPAFMHGKGRDGFTSEPGELGDGFTKRHHGTHGHVGWQAQEFLELGFLGYG